MKNKIYILAIFIMLSKTHALSFIKGPYLQNLQKESLTIMWETDELSDSTVYYKLMTDTSQNWQQVADRKKVKLHKVVITNLTAGSSYYYKVHSSSQTQKIHSARYHFKTAPATVKPFTFYVWGDNQYGIENFKRIKNYMQNPDDINKLFPKAAIKALDLAICVGDIVNNGKMLSSWQQELFDPLGSLMHTIPVYDAVGNHEIENKADDPVFGTISKRKQDIFREFNAKFFPTAENSDGYGGERQRSYYDRFFDIPSPSKGVRYFSFTYSNGIFIFLDSNVWHVIKGGKQYQWLLQTFRSDSYKNADFKFVFFHIPAVNRVWHKKGQRHKLVHKSFHKNLLPLFQQYGVDVVFSGHAHSYQKGKLVNQRGHTTNLIITGGGGASMDTVIYGDFKDIIKDEDIDIKHYHYLAVDIELKKAKITKIAFDDDFDPLAPEVVIELSK